MDVLVIHGDVQSVGSDLLVLKNANGFHGADEVVAEILGLPHPVEKGRVSVISSLGPLKPKQVAFVGVGPLSQFRYDGIREFARRAIRLVGETQLVGNVDTLSLTSHGAGYGLDEGEAFRALLAGLNEEVVQSRRQQKHLPSRILIVETNNGRARLFQSLLGEVQVRSGASPSDTGIDAAAVNSAGAASDELPVLFAAMPFEQRYFDEYKIAFLEAAKANGYLCERLDLATYVGDVLSEIKTRIAKSSGVLALMNDGNANVFLEIGYAWAKDKPTLLLLRRGQKAPFDVQGHRYIEYETISELRDRLTNEIGELKRRKVLV
jgi:hypothetical protein